MNPKDPRPLLLLVFALILTACGMTAQAAPARQQTSQPTLQPTETAVPLATRTPIPAPPPMKLPAVDWSDVSVHKKAMKPGFESDVDRFVDANRYLIIATLTTDNDAVIQGAERVRFTNRTPDTLKEIVFRLYPNAPILAGKMQVFNVTVEGKPVEPTYGAFTSVMVVPLEKPLAPKQSVEMTMDFATVMTVGLNASYGRFGYVSDIVSSTAWYPTLSVYDVGLGWWTSVPSPQGDPAYSETGLYDVRLTIPGEMTIAMSGTIIDTTKNTDGTVTYRDVTGPMRDFAFQASKRYLITSVMVDGTRINVMHYKDKAESPTDGTASAAKFSEQAVRIYNKTFGEYPFADLVVAQNPTPSGVEFPGLIQIAERSWVQGSQYLEIVIAHEIGHQWFYSLVGNNQVEHPWLDESLTSYTEFVYLRGAYSDPATAQRFIDNRQRSYSTYTGSGQADLPLDLPVRNYSGFAYGAIVYTKGPLFFIELERQLGQEVVYKALAEYFRRYKYTVVTSLDMKRTFEDVSGKDLTELFRKWVGNFPDVLGSAATQAATAAATATISAAR